MHPAVRSAHDARRRARRTRVAAHWCGILAHRRAASAARTAAVIAQAQDQPELASLHQAAALRHAARAATLEDRLLVDGRGAPDDGRPATVHVHLGFTNAASRDDVLLLLRGLGDWASGTLVALPDEGVRFEMRGLSPAQCEAIVWDRLHLALQGLDGLEDLVTVYAVRPHLP